MATIKRELSHKINGSGKAEIIIRITVCRGVQPRIRTGLYIAPIRFRDGTITKPRANQTEAAELRKVEAELVALEQYLIDLCSGTAPERLTREYLNEQIDRRRNPEKYREENTPADFFKTFDEFLDKRTLSTVRINNYRVLYRALRRFELYSIETRTGDRLTLDGMTAATLGSFETFLRTEHELFDRYPDIYAAIPADTRASRRSPRPTPRGDNTVCCIFKRLRAFFNWCNEQGLTDNRPFARYSGISSEKYGTPYYLTVEERDKIADFDLTGLPVLEAQRDIFIFHCLIGCRVSDLLRLTPANIIAGAVEYIASKTKTERPEVIRVPLHPRAVVLIRKYEGNVDGRLFPFISAQRYNDAIKRIFTLCGISRPVTVLNPTTGQEEQRPLNEIASSHIARRTFVGNLYKKVKDPNLVGKLSGHKEGSRAFARYRDIDEDMKRDLINLL